MWCWCFRRWSSRQSQSIECAGTEFHTSLLRDYVKLNEQRYLIQEHGGKLLLLTGPGELDKDWHGVPIHADPVGDIENWKTEALKALTVTFGQLDATVPRTLQQHFQAVLVRRRQHPAQKPGATFKRSLASKDRVFYRKKLKLPLKAFDI